MNTAHLLNLEPIDRTLIETAISRRFDLPALVDATSPHPAQHSLLSLIAWLDQPHIHTATETCIRIFTRAAAYAASLDAPAQAAALKRLLTSTLDLLDRSPLPSNQTDASDPAADKAITRNHRIGREARLLTAAIAKTTKSLQDQTNPQQRSPSEPRRTARHHTNPGAPTTSLSPTLTNTRTANSVTGDHDTTSPTRSSDAESINPAAFFTELALLNSELSHLALTLKANQGSPQTFDHSTPAQETPDSKPSDSST